MRYLSFLAFCLIITLMSCQQEKPAKKEIKEIKEIKDFKSSIKSVKGIRYTEVKRRFSNGLSFDTTGFQQEPSWIIEFYSADTILAWDPVQQKMQGFHLHYDHKDVYNFAKEWFRFKSVNKDSLVFQRLQVNDKAIADDIRSDVNMTFYADSYIKKLHTSAADLQRPSKADTTFIKQMIDRAERNPTNADSVFAGRIPVQLIPRDNRIQVEKISTVDRLNGRTEAYDYLYPRFRIVIPGAYKDFGYEFNVLVDSAGKMRLGKFYMNMDEYKETRKKVLQGIIDVYFANLLIIKPGTTLGLPHSSEITVSVKGKK
ncbi:hypothetical protein [Pedobacter antarcticus]|uniref:hypothetical protein n=1 Tax=Pedobacter antarcticus TaxID=34086 RepID=UPI00292D198A|nr:hypothetical protein [Pedobacter antarcticus]